jgi:hypothetical protein
MLHFSNIVVFHPYTRRSPETENLASPNGLVCLLCWNFERGLAVSATEGGVLEMAELPGFALEIAPGSVTFPGGGQEGLISATVVHSDKIPMLPEFSQQPRFVVTIQPSGARFDPPARLRLPNVDGLAPGAVTDLYSFDHDLGRFFSIGPGQVSEDGSSVVALPGFGILVAGWHCGGNPGPSGTPNNCKTQNICTTCIKRGPCQPDPEAGGKPCPDDGDICTTDNCHDGECLHWPAKIEKVEATGNEESNPEIFVGSCVNFKAQVDRKHCGLDKWEWTFGDSSDSDLEEPSHCYDEPGNFPYNVEVGCQDCARGTGNGSVRSSAQE